MITKRSKVFALLAIALLAINLRTAVSSISPVVTFIQKDIPLPIITLGLLGVAAPLAFAIATSLSYRPTRRFGVEKTVVLIVSMIVSGHLLRGFAWDSSALFAGSLLALLGAGMGNVLLPVMVRKYFSSRVGLISSFYITLTAISATTTSLIAVPVASAFGWRFSLGQWAFLAILTVIPLIALWANSKPEPARVDAISKKAIWKSPTAWAIAGVQGMTSVFGYVSFAWLPLLLIEHNGVSVETGGLMLSLFALMGLPASLLVPVLAARNPSSHRLIIWFSGLTGMIGPLGILWGSNDSLWIWVILTGLGPSMFPLALTLYNLRARERSTVLSVSAFGQGVSYVTATIAIFAVGVIREISGGWEFALWMLFGFAALSVVLGYQIGKNHFVDDELAH